MRYMRCKAETTSAAAYALPPKYERKPTDALPAAWLIPSQRLGLFQGDVGVHLTIPRAPLLAHFVFSPARFCAAKLA